MGRYIDPICYQFTFNAIVHEKEPLPVSAFLHLAAGCKAWLTEEGNRGRELPLDLFVGYGRNLADHPWLFRGTHTIADLDLAFCEHALLHTDCRILILSDDFLPRPSVFTSGGKKNGQIFDHLLKKTKREEIDEAWIQEFCNFVSCPTERLKDIRIPLTAARGWNMLDIYWRAEKISEDREVLRTVVAGDYDPTDAVFLEIALRVPRFIIDNEASVSAVQEDWIRTLLELGNRYPLGAGTIMMDTPTFHQPLGLTCYDQIYDGKRNFLDAVPGCAWGMLLNAQQRKSLASDDTGIFERTVDLENGSRYYQMTKDMRCMTREHGTLLRDHFKAAFPNKPLMIMWDGMPPSFRLCCRPEEIRLDGKGPHLLSIHTTLPHSI